MATVKKEASKKVFPNDKVEFEWKGSKFHKDGVCSMLHPVMAQKMAEQGKGSIVKDGKVEKTAAPNEGTIKV